MMTEIGRPKSKVRSRESGVESIKTHDRRQDGIASDDAIRKKLLQKNLTPAKKQIASDVQRRQRMSSLLYDAGSRESEN